MAFGAGTAVRVVADGAGHGLGHHGHEVTKPVVGWARGVLGNKGVGVLLVERHEPRAAASAGQQETVDGALSLDRHAPDTTRVSGRREGSDLILRSMGQESQVARKGRALETQDSPREKFQRELALERLKGGGTLLRAMETLASGGTDRSQVRGAFHKLFRTKEKCGYRIRGNRETQECTDKHCDRRIQRRHEYDELCDRLPTQDRIAAMLTQWVRVYWAKCNYRQAQGRWAGGENTLKVSRGAPPKTESFIGAIAAALDHVPSVKSKKTKVWSANGKWSGTSVEHEVIVAHDWHESVRKRGLAVVEGRFVLEAQKDGIDQVSQFAGMSAYRATWVEQARGLLLETRTGYIVRDASGRMAFGNSVPGAKRRLKHAQG